jgi:2-polyprenyl-3-methyl-5-hydroxy-6-metoxy-1,4-benzoquinol methylase
MPYLEEPYDASYYVGNHDGGYTDFATINPQWWINIADDIEANTGLVSGKRVLEVGCAYGFLTDLLAQRGADVSGIDISAFAIGEANSRFPTLDFIEDDFLSSGAFSNNTFDLIVSCGAIECMSNDSEMSSFLSRARAWLKPNGTYYFLIDYNTGPVVYYQNKTVSEWLTAMAAGLPGPFDFDVEDVGHLSVMYATRVVVT